jgi:spoIIIJ-associated protein
MFSPETIKTIEKIIREFFQKSTFEAEIIEIREENGIVSVNLRTEEPQILIGEGGQTLADIQHLLKIILKRKLVSLNEADLLSGPFYLNLDINNYKQKKCEYLKEMAVAAADEVGLDKKEKILPAMPSYERRIVHLALADRSDIVTESIGQEPERKIVIRPKA